MAKKKTGGFCFSWRQMGYVVLLALFVSYLVAVSEALQRGRAAQALVSEIESEIAALQAEQAQLEKELEYAQSDAYVEQAARTELKWSKPGETVIVPIDVSETPVPEDMAPPPLGAPTPEVSPKSRWEEFIGFFGR